MTTWVWQLGAAQYRLVSSPWGYRWGRCAGRREVGGDPARPAGSHLHLPSRRVAHFSRRHLGGYPMTVDGGFTDLATQFRGEPLGSLLPDGGVCGRGRGSGSGDIPEGVAVLRPVRGPFIAAHLAVSHRDQRLPDRDRAAHPPAAAVRAGWPGRRPQAPLVAAPEAPWLQPLPEALLGGGHQDPAALAASHAGIRLAFVAALQYLSARQRAVLILRDVLEWPAVEVADLLDTTTTAVNSGAAAGARPAGPGAACGGGAR